MMTESSSEHVLTLRTRVTYIQSDTLIIHSNVVILFIPQRSAVE